MLLTKAIETLTKSLPENYMALIDTCEYPSIKVLHNGKEWTWRAYAGERSDGDYSDCTMWLVEIHEKDSHGNRTDYIGSITLYDSNEESWELAECYYPLHGSEFSLNDTKYDEEQTQVNIFGYWKTFAGALNSLLTKGNSTKNHRKPVDIYV